MSAFISQPAPTLEQVTRAGSSTTQPITFVPSTNQPLAAGTAISADATIVQISGSGGAVVLTSTPIIADGNDGQWLRILGTDEVNTVELQDESALAGSNLELTAGVNFILGQGDSIDFVFHSDTGKWVEVSRSDN